MKRYSIIAALLACVGQWQASAILATGINAIVHESVVTYEEVGALTGQTEDILRRQYARNPEEFQKRMAKAREENLEKLTNRQLILHEFQTAGYALPDSVVNDIVESRIRAVYKDRRTAAKTLQARGMNFEKLREQERERFIVDAMRNKNISSEIMISPAKIAAYYKAHPEQFKVEDQVKMRLIVLNKSSDTNAPDARKMCEEILSQIKSGASFAEMATNYSQGGEAKQGGERPWDVISDLRKELADAARAIKPGEVSEVIDTAEACYLIKIEDKKLEHVKPLVDVREEIEQDLLTQERDRLEKLWMAKLKKKTFVRYFP